MTTAELDCGCQKKPNDQVNLRAEGASGVITGDKVPEIIGFSVPLLT